MSLHHHRISTRVVVARFDWKRAREGVLGR
jgi:hypothetical protein